MSPIRNPCAYARATGWLAVALAGLSACAHGQLNIPSGCRLAREQCTANPTGVYRLDFGPTSATSGVAGMRTWVPLRLLPEVSGSVLYLIIDRSFSSPTGPLRNVGGASQETGDRGQSTTLHRAALGLRTLVPS